MSWWAYVERVTGDDDGVTIAGKLQVNQSTVSRWRTSDTPGKVENVVALARAYGRPVLEALLAAEFLTEQEARVRPRAAPDYTQLTNDELLELVRARMREEGELGGDTAATTPPDIGPGGRKYPATVKKAARSKGVKK